MYLYNIQCTYTLYNNIQYVVYIHIYKMIYNTVRLYDIQHYNIMYTYTYNITYMRTQPPHCMVYSYIFMFFLKTHTHIYIIIIYIIYVTIYIYYRHIHVLSFKLKQAWLQQVGILLSSDRADDSATTSVAGSMGTRKQSWFWGDSIWFHHNMRNVNRKNVEVLKNKILRKKWCVVSDINDKNRVTYHLSWMRVMATIGCKWTHKWLFRGGSHKHVMGKTEWTIPN